MLTWLLIFALPGSLVFGGAAWAWRYRLKRQPMRLLALLPVVLLVWFASMLFGWFIYLDVLRYGPLGAATNAGVTWSLVPALLIWYILRKQVEPPIPVNTSNYFSKK